MDDSERAITRAYMDALNDYERITKEAVTVARHMLIRLGPDVHPVDLDTSPEVAEGAASDVLLRWHVSLIRVLGAWDRLPHSHQADHEVPEQQLSVD
jgi:hypothetical protein